ncbi:hypothetical protein COY20_03400 [Candidatus Shapirobacteria bacterium CG_4_10_14_0_2_um_filter_40_12]|uniref:Uncharacterized protein n=1 Tax=Candidatus Shapirobacteria bacterium CG_4_10_14_0_2_um_filter_40_12 TaxID=1974871 RepID=A0A2M7TSI0_9BACT|nr:MAG: hypothetical protein COY20_03400 [Candidatus Shapirobacteria bacterium CG_4_10_14_0_2_um_filter_40_12]
MNNKYIIYMKAGPYCGYSLKEIEKIKNNEDKLYGKFYWGYGGVFCHPKRVLEFVKSAIKRGEKILVYFSITKSKFNSPIPRCHYQSADKNNWKRLSSEVILVGNQYSLVCTNLKRANFFINLFDYSATLGDKPGKSLGDYVKYRVDKATAILKKEKTGQTRNIDISYVCELVPPYCVYVK